MFVVFCVIVFVGIARKECEQIGRDFSDTATAAAANAVQPVLFAGLLNAHSNKGPAEIPAKRRQIFLDCVRSAQLMQIPFALPPSHPFNPLPALRAMVALESRPASQLHFMRHTLNACWGRGVDISQPARLAEIAEECGLHGEELLQQSNEDAVKAKLRFNTEHAVSLGVFGVPTMRVDDELFWGSDRMHHLEAHLEGRLSVDRAAFEQMISVPRSADRKEFRHNHKH